MIYKNRILQWIFTTFALGLALGYLFSSKFCKTSIGARVEKEIALNQKLRDLFAKNSFLTTSTLNAAFFNVPIKEILAQELVKNNNETIDFLGMYYGKKSLQGIRQLLNHNASLITKLGDQKSNSATKEDFKTTWNNNADTIAAEFAQLNPALSSERISDILKEQFSVIMQISKALQTGDGQTMFNAFDKLFEHSLYIADKLDKSITQQFPQKF